MHQRVKAAIAIGMSLLLATSTPVSAKTLRTESDPVLNGTVKPMTDPKPVKLRLVRDKSERTRDMAILKAGVATIPLVAPFSAPGPKQTEFLCEVSTQDVHARKSSNYETIGPKPLTKCPRRVTYIVHRTTLEYFQNGRWNPVLPTYYDVGQNTRILLTLKIEHPCQGFRQMQWASETTSYVFDDERYYKATVWAKPQRIACGT